MEPKFQNSFIPKNVAVSSALPKEPSSFTVNIFSIIAGVLFAVVLLASGALFIYKNVLTNGIAQADKDLDAARKAFEPEKISELITASANIASATDLLEKHVVVSKLLVLLQQLTVKRLKFNSLTYANKEGHLSVAGDVEARSYNALAEQLNILTADESIKNPVFSDLSLGANGVVRLKLYADLVPKLVSYKDFVDSRSVNTTAIQ